MTAQQKENPCIGCKHLEVRDSYHFCRRWTKGVNIGSLVMYGPLLLNCKGEK